VEKRRRTQFEAVGVELDARRRAREGELLMKNETAFQFVKEIVVENRENGELEGTLNRSRVAALNRILLLAEPEFLGRRRGTQVVIYKKRPSARVGVLKYRRIGSLKLVG
jgi:hypothetical protein